MRSRPNCPEVHRRVSDSASVDKVDLAENLVMSVRMRGRMEDGEGGERCPDSPKVHRRVLNSTSIDEGGHARI